MSRAFYQPWRESLLRGEQSWPDQTHELFLLSDAYRFHGSHKSLDDIPRSAILARAEIPGRRVDGSCLFGDDVVFPQASSSAGKVAAVAIYNSATDTLVLFNGQLIGRNIQSGQTDLAWQWANCGIACYCTGTEGGCR